MLLKVSRGNLLLISMLLVLIGVGIGVAGFLTFGNFVDRTTVLFIAKNEIIELEAAAANKENRDIFFGKPDEALALIKKAAAIYENNRIKVIILSEDSNKVIGAKSISKEVHQLIIDYQRNKQ